MHISKTAWVNPSLSEESQGLHRGNFFINYANVFVFLFKQNFFKIL